MHDKREIIANNLEKLLSSKLGEMSESDRLTIKLIVDQIFEGVVEEMEQKDKGYYEHGVPM